MSGPASGSSRGWRLLGAWVVLVLLGTLHPFTLEPGSVLVPSDTFWIPRFKSLDPPFNVLMFVPLGWAFAAGGRRRAEAWAAGLAFSALIEGLQHYVCFRVPVAEDLVMNTLGAGLGYRLGPWLSAHSAGVDGHGVRKAAFAGVAAFVLWSAAPPIITPKLWGWAERAELIVGRERPGNYRWPGEVRAARLWVGTSSAGAPDWDLARDGEGIFEDLARRTVQAQAFLLQTELRGGPAPTGLDGPARVLVWSGGVQRRNLMLAQHEDELWFRLRTRVSPIVGRLPDRTEPLVLPAVPPGRTSTVTVRYAEGRLAGAVDGAWGQGVLRDLPPHNGVRRFWLPRRPWGAWIYAFSAAFVGALALAGPGWRRRAFALGLLLFAVTEGLQIAQFSRPPDAVAALFAFLGAALASLTAREPSADPTAVSPSASRAAPRR